MDSKIIFIHIPKTAGSSFMKDVVHVNLSKEQVYYPKGFSDVFTINRKRTKFITGHLPFGIHKFLLTKNVKYITFFRNPIERAISHYYFVLQSNYSTFYKHPDWELHNSVPLSEIFNTNKKKEKSYISPFTSDLLDNLMTRYISGFGNNYMSRNSNYMLHQAKKNLIKYFDVFGIQEEYDRSINIITRYFGWETNTGSKLKVTLEKPKIDGETLKVVSDNHQLDVELYEFAKERFEKIAKTFE